MTITQGSKVTFSVLARCNRCGKVVYFVVIDQRDTYRGYDVNAMRNRMRRHWCVPKRGKVTEQTVLLRG